MWSQLRARQRDRGPGIVRVRGCGRGELGFCPLDTHFPLMGRAAPTSQEPSGRPWGSVKDVWEAEQDGEAGTAGACVGRSAERCVCGCLC